jgi:hypothetical protein
MTSEREVLLTAAGAKRQAAALLLDAGFNGDAGPHA